MEKPVPAVEAERINLFSAATNLRKQANCLPAALSVSSRENSMRISVVFFGCNSNAGLQKGTFGAIPYRFFELRKGQRGRRQQMQKVLQLLSVSRVIRPTHVEPRNVSPLPLVNDYNGQDSASCQPELPQRIAKRGPSRRQ